MFAAAEVAKLTQEEYFAYVDDLKDYRDVQNIIDTAKAKGLAKGLAKGEAKGLAKGLAEGEAKGEAQIVINIHQSGLPIETIAVITGLTHERITEILKQNKAIP
jgi:predicted transposase YdaD